MRITHNELSAFSLRQVKSAEKDELSTKEQLSSGRRINHAGDDAAGLAISDRLAARHRGIHQAWRNAYDAQALVRTAEGAYEGVNEMLQRVRALAIQASNDTLITSDRQNIQLEVTALLEEIDRQSDTVEYNGKKLFAPTTDPEGQEYTFQVGSDRNETLRVDVAPLNATWLGVEDLDVSSRVSADSAIAAVDGALNRLNGQRADVGSVQNRLDEVMMFTGIARENTIAAETKIRDADFGPTITDYTKQQILRSTRLSALAQANLQPESVLQLLNA